MYCIDVSYCVYQLCGDTGHSLVDFIYHAWQWQTIIFIVWSFYCGFFYWPDIWLNKPPNDRSNCENTSKMADGWLLFLALGIVCMCIYILHVACVMCTPVQMNNFAQWCELKLSVNPVRTIWNLLHTYVTKLYVFKDLGVTCGDPQLELHLHLE